MSSSPTNPLPAADVAASAGPAVTSSGTASTSTADAGAHNLTLELPGLPTMPPEVWLQILRRLDYSDLKLRVQLVSKAFGQLVADPSLDRVLFRGRSANEQLDAEAAAWDTHIQAFQEALHASLSSTPGFLLAMASQKVLVPVPVDIHPLFARVKWFGPDHEHGGAFIVRLKPPVLPRGSQTSGDDGAGGGDVVDDSDHNEWEGCSPEIPLSEIPASCESATWPASDKIVVKHLGDSSIPPGAARRIHNEPGKAVSVGQVLRALSKLCQSGWMSDSFEGVVGITDGERQMGWPRPSGYGKDGIVLWVG